MDKTDVVQVDIYDGDIVSACVDGYLVNACHSQTVALLHNLPANGCTRYHRITSFGHDANLAFDKDKRVWLCANCGGPESLRDDYFHDSKWNRPPQDVRIVDHRKK
jgi:hypothetical protein